MKAFIIGQNSNEDFYEQDNDINNINSVNYLKYEGISKSCKVFPENNLIKLKYENEYLNKYININKPKKLNTNNRNINTNKNNKWQKDLKNRIYNNYYNKDIRNKYSNMCRQ